MANSPALPPFESLQTAGNDTLKSVLDLLFEPSPTLHDLSIPRIRDELPSHTPSVSAPTLTYDALIRNVGSLLYSLVEQSSSSPPSRATLHAILGSHPRLGEKKVDSAQSRAEQAQLNASSHSASAAADGSVPLDEEAQRRRQEEEEAEKQLLADLNAEYEARFPGLRYVVFVNGRARPAILRNMRDRIARGDAAAEEREAISAMVDIALDRARKLGA